jgi:tight adherence protein C
VTRAQLLAAAAGVACAGGLVDAARAWVGRPRREVSRSRPMLAVLRALGRPGARGRSSRGLGDLLAAAGVRMPEAEVVSLKAGAAVAALLGVLPLAPALPGRLGWAAVVAAPLAGLHAPEIVLRRRARRRAARMDAELPDVLDLLRVAVGAGAPPGRALAEVGRRHPGELAAELGEAARRESLGVPREESLRELRRRAPAPAIGALTAAIARSARHGAPLDEPLAALAADARARHARAAAEAAARAAPKIQLIVALVLVPAVLALVAAGLIPALAGRT